ncbi:tetratricopeptide repeat protein [Lacrimispora sp. 210928-DFI.3.58]|uniref:tetratricopeptide repeat protein n=1 Tax=Lacrimispora sp. 210928-DFI.3.58 TaxID=2883214 RepID=UPI001D07C0AE|nr:tetratricopeptide repeat protein [Lacrimispora sp. 210928-DFI.3.58]MCB7317759.1 tetratricopeptide repeat protein [Lacrimispora sp. 210928-DFI.3.58]
MDYEKKNRQIANSYYNLGLEKAKIRDLSGAAQCLKKSLHFNKYQTDARNLLGLIYYENGEVADALVQWVISLNLQPENNLADHYLDEIQRKPGQLEVESQNVKTFNQALWHAQNGSDDLAILQLARVVEARPHFVKAHLLLALLYMGREDYNKAGRSLYKILQIDKSNPKALYYMSIVKQNTGRADVEKRKMVKAFSHRQMQDDDVIIPNTYKENTGISTVFHIIVGLLLGMMAFYFLVMPARERDLNRQRDSELTSYMQKLNNANRQNDILKEDYDTLKAQADEVQSQLDELTTGNTSVMAQYQSLIYILQNYRTGDTAAAAKAFAEAGFDLIEDETIQAIVEDIRQDMTANVYQTLVDRGLQVWNAGDKTQAMDLFQASLTIQPDNPEAIFYVGRLYQDAGDMDNANTMFDKVVNEYPDSEYVSRARNARGY